MSAISVPVSLYDGLLMIATPTERTTILAGGPRKRLDHAWAFAEDHDEWMRVRAAHDAIQSVLLRMHFDPTLCITGIDSRVSPPKREVIENEVVRAGRLRWEGAEGQRSILHIKDLGPHARIIDLRIEPVRQLAHAPSSPPPASSGLRRGERRLDTDRLALMREHIAAGHPRKTAARMAAAALPDPHTSEESLTSRLIRKFIQWEQT
jgi:hypothetical protein